MIPEEILIFVSKILKVVWVFIKTWWWVLPPFLLWRPFLFFYLQWRQKIWSKKQEYQMLEIKMPREVTRPFKAMEQVFASWWMLYDPPDWWEKWIEGKYQLSMFIEIVSLGGEIHFYLYAPKPMKNLLESSLYAQYPDAEIIEAQDYTELVPPDIPNEEWDLWGCDYEMNKPDVYPIKTYPKFFEESAGLKEEKRIDPLASLLEGMSKLKPGENAWVQIKLTPVTNGDNNFKDRAQKIVNKLLKRPSPPVVKFPPILKEAFELLAYGKMPEGPKIEKEEHLIPPEMQLSPGEREIVAAIEHKVSKPMFQCWIRFVIMGKKGIFYKPNLKNILGFFANFNTENLNGLKPWGKSITKVKKYERGFLNIFFYDSLLYLKKRRIFKRYKQRMPLFYPRPSKEFIFNTEELATIFHCIGREAVPAPEVQRIESKKSEPPPNLPT